MRAPVMLRLCFLIFLSLALSNLSEARQERKHQSAVLVGSVYCDACSQQSFSKASHFISGAVVAIECLGTKATPKFTEEVSTNEHGKFQVLLPFSVNKHVKKINRCSVKLIKSSEPSCAVASTSSSSALHSKSIKEGKHIFSAGFLTFKPLKQPELCDQKRNVQDSKVSDFQKSNSNPDDLSYLPPIQNPPTSNLPLPQLPNLPPLLPQLPPLPPIPFLPPFPLQASSNKGIAKNSELANQKVAQTQSFGPNPFIPPSLFPPLVPSPPSSITSPIVSSPPTSIFSPLFPSPSTSSPSLFPPGNLPPAVPGFSPSPLLPTPLVPRFPLPPFGPVPGFPGVPPAVKSTSSKNSLP